MYCYLLRYFAFAVERRIEKKMFVIKKSSKSNFALKNIKSVLIDLLSESKCGHKDGSCRTLKSYKKNTA